MCFPSEVLNDLPAAWVLGLAGALIAAEVGTLVGVALPGVTAVLALGYLGRLDAVDPVYALAVAIACEIVGGHLAYATGRRARRERSGGPIRRHIARLDDRVSRTPAWSRGMGLLERRGVRAVLLCQWIGGVRTLTPRLVGSAGMSYRTFAAAQVPSAVVWVCTWMSVGAVVGAAYERTATGVTVVGLVVLATGLLAVTLWSAPRMGEREGMAADLSADDES